MPDFPEVAKPLTNMTMKNRGFLWVTDEQLAFERMKHRFSTTPVLACPNFEQPFVYPL
jgi:hypothetical protein